MDKVNEGAAFEYAWKVLTDYCVGGGKVSDLLNGLPVAGRKQAQYLLMAVFRDFLFLESLLMPLLQRKPKAKLRALLLLALGECLNADEGRRAQVLHFSVGQAKRKLSLAEGALVNAVLRKTVLQLGVPPQHRARLNHPDWLYARWEEHFGKEAADLLCAWNQKQAPVYLRCADKVKPEGAKETDWAGFYRVDPLASAVWLPMVQSGAAYIQDPMTRHPVELLAVNPGDRVLDICAAPGGKSCWFLQQLARQGSLVAVDVPGVRSERLRENLARQRSGNYRVLECRLPVSETEWVEAVGGAATTFEKVLIDVPCSNTGVLQRKPDVRLRLKPEDLTELPRQQLEWLRWAARRVGHGGQLVYSTCSIEPEENEGVISSFLALVPEFQLVARVQSYPWVDRHDGGGAFLLKRR